MTWLGRDLGIAVLGGLLLAAATPPAWFAGAALLVLPGLAIWFALATGARRPLWASYVLGCVHMAMFSWSVRHVLLFAYVAIVLLGGVYYLLAAAAVRRWRGAAAPFVFALAVGAVFWLRAVMPQVSYPHAQPCHVLWEWPASLTSVVIGGEPLANALLAGVAASAVGLYRSWRVAVPALSRTIAAAAIALGAWLAATLGGHVLAASGESTAAANGPSSVAVAVVEPGFHLWDELAPFPREQQGRRFGELLEARLLAPTRGVLAEAAPPAVVLWPESSVFDEVPIADVDAGTARLQRIRLPVSNTRLLLGVNVDGDGPPTPSAVMVETGSGRVLAHQEKRHLVPGGEFQPFLGWLPVFVSDALREAFRNALFTLPEATHGRELPPLRDAAGVPFGALLCYDNAFPGPATAQVAQGARWLAVLSNEAWYRGGGELAQLMAMTVVRALETATPIVRCTQDGWSGLVDANGRLVADLPILPSPQPVARILRVDVPLGSGQLPPLAWLRSATGPACALALAFLLLHALVGRARLRAARTASHAPAALGSRPGAHGSGS